MIEIDCREGIENMNTFRIVNRPVPIQERLARVKLYRNLILTQRYPDHLKTVRSAILRILDQRIQNLKKLGAA